MKNNKIKQMLNQIETPDGLKEELLDVQKTGRKTRKRSVVRWTSVAAAIVMIAAVGAGTVYAADRIWGIRDLLQNLPNGAEQYINTEVDVISTNDTEIESLDEKEADLVMFAVSESIADSYACHIAIEVELTDPEHYLLVPHYAIMDELSSAKEYYADALEGETIMEYAQRVNKQVVGVSSVIGTQEEQDGKTCQETVGNMMIIDGKHALLKLEAVVRDKDGALSEMEDGQEIPIVNTVIIEDEALCWHVCKEEAVMVSVSKTASDEETATYGFDGKDAVRVGNSTVLIEKVTLTNTPLETKAQINVINEDKEAGNWISVCLMDDEGNFINNGVSGMGEAAKPDSNGAFVVIGIYEKMDLPDHINLRVKDLNSGEVDYLENIPRLEE